MTIWILLRLEKFIENYYVQSIKNCTRQLYYRHLFNHRDKTIDLSFVRSGFIHGHVWAQSFLITF
jgi:hypothetical protein